MPNDLSQVIADNPYPDEANPSASNAVFRSEDMGADGLADRDEFHAII